MSAFSTFVEVKMIRTIEIVHSVQDVLACVRVNDVEENCDSETVSDIYELFEIFRVTFKCQKLDQRADLERKRSQNLILREKKESQHTLTISTTGCEEVGDLITETSIVSMFLNSHQLNYVVSELLDAREKVAS